MSKVDRCTVDLSRYPDLVVIYLGMRVNAWRGLKMLFRLGPQIKDSVAAKPDGLSLHEDVFFSLFPPHLACANIGATSPHSRRGADRRRIAIGGKTSCAIRVAPAFGTRPTLPPCRRRAATLSQHAGGLRPLACAATTFRNTQRN